LFSWGNRKAGVEAGRDCYATRAVDLVLV